MSFCFLLRQRLLLLRQARRSLLMPMNVASRFPMRSSRKQLILRILPICLREGRLRPFLLPRFRKSRSVYCSPNLLASRRRAEQPRAVLVSRENSLCMSRGGMPLAPTGISCAMERSSRDGNTSTAIGTGSIPRRAAKWPRAG